MEKQTETLINKERLGLIRNGPLHEDIQKVIYLKEDVREAIKEAVHRINWRSKALGRNEYTHQQTFRNIRKDLKEIFGEGLIK